MTICFILQVTGVVGRAECLSSIFFLAALWSYSKCTGYKAKTGMYKTVYMSQCTGIYNVTQIKAIQFLTFFTCNGNVRGSRKAKKIIIIQFGYYSIM